MQKAETSCAFFEYDEQKRIVFITLKDKSDIGIEESKEMAAITKKLTQGKPYLTLVDGRAEVNVTRESREFAVSPRGQNNMKAEAIVVNNLAQKIIGNFFIRINKPKYPTRLFSNLNDAEEWLLEQLKVQ
jgi:hypothetical protein